MTEYGFEESVDYQVFVRFDENPSGGHPAMDHQLTIDMAKEKVTGKGQIYFVSRFCSRDLVMA